MAKYQFSVILNDNSQHEVTLEELENAKLYDIDNFIMKIGYSKLSRLLANELSIDFLKIEYIAIVNSKNKNIRFSIINKNEYLEPVFYDIYTREMQRYTKTYRSLETVISNDNEAFKEMYKYLLNELRSNPQKFLTSIYKYQNNFSNLLHQYGMSYQNNSNTEEEQRNIEELERQIKEELSIYKNYRGLCIARSKAKSSFYTLNKSNPITESKKAKPIIKSTPTIIEEPKMTQDDANDLNQFVNLVGEEKEEFLEPDEMDYDNYKKHY